MSMGAVKPVKSLVATVTVVCAALAVSGCDSSRKAESPAPSTTTTVTLPVAQVRDWQSRLASGKPERIAPILAGAVRAKYEARPWSMLGTTSKVQVAGSLIVAGETATIPATVVGGDAEGSWLLLLVREEGEWRVFGTRRA